MTLFGSIRGRDSVESESEQRAALARETRVRVARGNHSWTELAETALVRRGPWLVDADSDRLYSVHRGAVFNEAGGILFDETRQLAFYVSRGGDVVMLEPSVAPRTWSEVVALRASRRPARASS